MPHVSQERRNKPINQNWTVSELAWQARPTSRCWRERLWVFSVNFSQMHLHCYYASDVINSIGVCKGVYHTDEW